MGPESTWGHRYWDRPRGSGSESDQADNGRESGTGFREGHRSRSWREGGHLGRGVEGVSVGAGTRFGPRRKEIQTPCENFLTSVKIVRRTRKATFPRFIQSTIIKDKNQYENFDSVFIFPVFVLRATIQPEVEVGVEKGSLSVPTGKTCVPSWVGWAGRGRVRAKHKMCRLGHGRQIGSSNVWKKIVYLN